MDDEATLTGGDRAQVDRRAEAAGTAEHDIGAAGVTLCISSTVGTTGADDEIIEAVIVQVTGRSDGSTGVITRVLAVDDEAALARGDGGKVYGRAEAAGAAEYDVGVACPIFRVAGGVGKPSADDQIIEAVAVQVTGGRNRDAGLVVHILAVDDEAALAQRDRAKIDRCETT